MHVYGLLPLCDFTWLSYEKTFIHWPQGYAFVPICVLKCLFKLQFTEKAIGHYIQIYGFLLVCILKCFFKFLFNENAFEDLLQKYHFWPWHILKWLFKFLSSEKYFWHWVHWWDFSPMCVLKCFFIISILWESLYILHHLCVISHGHLMRKPLYTDHKYMVLYQYVFSNVYSNCHLLKKP